MVLNCAFMPVENPQKVKYLINHHTSHESADFPFVPPDVIINAAAAAATVATAIIAIVIDLHCCENVKMT